MLQGKDEVKIAAGKQFCSPVIEPALFDQSVLFKEECPRSRFMV
jgi:hypothetical protein